MNELTKTPLDTTTASATDQVFKVLYDAVISVKLPPGTKVSETEIAKQLDVSRQPVRDAFFRLSQLGFLAIRPQRATLITQISEAAVLDAVFTRTALEVECLRVAYSKMKPTDLATLRACLGKQKKALKSDPAVLYDLDEDFHETLCNISGHVHVWSLIKEQKAHMDRIRYLTLSESRRPQVVQEHQEIVEQLAEDDLRGAEESLRAHFASVTIALSDLRREYPGYFE